MSKKQTTEESDLALAGTRYCAAIAVLLHQIKVKHALHSFAANILNPRNNVDLLVQKSK